MTREEQAAEVQRQAPNRRREAAILVASGLSGAELDLALNPPPVPVVPVPNTAGKKARKAKQAASVGA